MKNITIKKLRVYIKNINKNEYMKNINNIMFNIVNLIQFLLHHF